MDQIIPIAMYESVHALATPALFNLYFLLLAIPLGFPIALGLSLAKSSRSRVLRLSACTYIYALRGSPLLIQLFMIYHLMLALNLAVWKPLGIDHIVLNPLVLGPFVLALNSSAYTAEILHGSIQLVPIEEIEAGKSVGLNRRQLFRFVIWPNMIRMAWPAYTNEAIFLFHATSLVYFVLPVIDDQQDLMNKAGELFETDYNVFLHFSVAALYFLAISLMILKVYNAIYRHMNRHMDDAPSLKWKPVYMR